MNLLVRVLLLAIAAPTSIHSLDIKSHAISQELRYPKCTTIKIPITVTATTAVFSSQVVSNISRLTDNNSVLLGLAAIATDPNITYTATTANLSISARYCEPEVAIPSRRSTIQLLVHGVTYTNEYWSALRNPSSGPEPYSWIKFASRQGFPTLSIDRPGNGASTHPDPLSVDQNSLQVEVLAFVADGLKAGTITDRSFSKVIYVGHSYGSMLGNNLATICPTCADALILTGVSSTLSPNVVSSVDLVPAVTFASRFTGLATGYVVTGSAMARRTAFYGRNGTFDPKIFALDINKQDVTSLGELTTLGLSTASNSSSPVIVIAGKQDAVFCFVNTTVQGDCGSGPSSPPALMNQYFPVASSFSYKIVDGMGHNLNLHYKARQTFMIAHNWLTLAGF